MDNQQFLTNQTPPSNQNYQAVTSPTKPVNKKKFIIGIAICVAVVIAIISIIFLFAKASQDPYLEIYYTRATRFGYSESTVNLVIGECQGFTNFGVIPKVTNQGNNATLTVFQSTDCSSTSSNQTFNFGVDECNCEYSKYYGAVKPQGSEGFLDDNDNKGEGGFFCDDAYKIYSRNYGNLTEGLIC